jgi:hypothetical protein
MTADMADYLKRMCLLDCHALQGQERPGVVKPVQSRGHWACKGYQGTLEVRPFLPFGQRPLSAPRDA